jgi:hypothetical protein
LQEAGENNMWFALAARAFPDMATPLVNMEIDGWG